MTILNNVKIEYEEAEDLIKKYDENEINHLISKLLKDEALKQKKDSKWAKFAKERTKKNTLNGKSEEVVKLNQEFRENFIF